jgi:hypothetical protein
VLPLLLGVVAVTLAGCASAAPSTSAEQAPASSSINERVAAVDDATIQADLVLAASEELDPAITPPGFSFVETVGIDGSGATSTIYVQGQPEDQGPGLYVYAVPAGVEVEHLGDAWTPEPLPELSADLPVTVVSDPEGSERSVVSIDASPAGTVHLIGDGVPRAELVAMAGRLLADVG